MSIPADVDAQTSPCFGGEVKANIGDVQTPDVAVVVFDGEDDAVEDVGVGVTVDDTVEELSV